MVKNNLEKILKKASREYRIYRAHKYFLRSLTLSLMLFLLLFILNIFQPAWSFWRELWYLFLAVPGIGILTGLGLPVNKKKLYARIDERLELEEKLITYQELKNTDPGNPYLELIRDSYADELKSDVKIFSIHWNPEIKYLTSVLMITVLVFLGAINRIHPVFDSADFTGPESSEEYISRQEVEAEREEQSTEDFLVARDEDEEVQDIEDTLTPEDFPEQRQDEYFSGETDDLSEEERGEFREREEGESEEGNQEGEITPETGERNGFNGQEEDFTELDPSEEEKFNDEGEFEEELPFEFSQTPQQESSPSFQSPEDDEMIEDDEEIEETEEQLPRAGDFEDTEDYMTESEQHSAEYEIHRLDRGTDEELIIAEMENLTTPDGEGLDLDELDFDYAENIPERISFDNIPVTHRDLIINYLEMIGERN